MKSRYARLLKNGVTFYLPLGVVLILFLFPFYWMFITSLRFEADVFNFSESPLLLTNPSLDNYRYLINTPLFGRWFLNSFIVSIVTTLFSLLLSVMAGYSIARLKFRGAALIGTLIFIAYLIPRTLLFIPIAQLMNSIKLLGDVRALLLSFPTFLIPFCTWLLTGYFRTIPIDLEECAMVDGCTRLGAVRRITLPLALPGILTAGIFAFTFSWNELLYPLVLVAGDANKTLTLGVMGSLVRQDYYFWGPLMAASTLASIPVAILFFFFMDFYVSGLTAGAVKG